jgi:hypothetical protein
MDTVSSSTSTGESCCRRKWSIRRLRRSLRIPNSSESDTGSFAIKPERMSCRGRCSSDSKFIPAIDGSVGKDYSRIYAISLTKNVAIFRTTTEEPATGNSHTRATVLLRRDFTRDTSVLEYLDGKRVVRNTEMKTPAVNWSLLQARRGVRGACAGRRGDGS